jgi:hypothetical protein
MDPFVMNGDLSDFIKFSTRLVTIENEGSRTDN